MAKYRMIRTEFWKNPIVMEEMTPEDKYFYLYLLTNPQTTQIGSRKGSETVPETVCLQVVNPSIENKPGIDGTLHRNQDVKAIIEFWDMNGFGITN